MRRDVTQDLEAAVGMLLQPLLGASPGSDPPEVIFVSTNLCLFSVDQAKQALQYRCTLHGVDPSCVDDDLVVVGCC